jgi:hypothetical protein
MDHYPSNRLIWALFAVTVAIGGVTLAHREQLSSGAHWITKTLCEDRQVLNGSYKRCIDHYAPAGPDGPL